MATSTYYSHIFLMNKNGSEKQELLFEKGINWHDYPDFFKRGTYIQRKRVKRKFTTDELSKLPIKHEAIKPLFYLQNYLCSFCLTKKVSKKIGNIFNYYFQ